MTATSPGMQGGKRERKVWSQRPHSLPRRGEERECRFPPLFFSHTVKWQTAFRVFFYVWLYVYAVRTRAVNALWLAAEGEEAKSMCSGRRRRSTVFVCVCGGEKKGMNRSFTPKYEQKWEAFVRPKNGEEKKIVLHTVYPRHVTLPP